MNCYSRLLHFCVTGFLSTEAVHKPVDNFSKA
jgi:hypothetical protein